jgi:hypothetical protein
MVIPVPAPRRSTSVRDAVLGGSGRQLYQPLRCAFYDGGAGGLPGDGLAAALSESEEPSDSDAAACVPAGCKRQAARNVLILMSDTGGGHRASAEALRDAFRIEFGDAYKVGSSSRSACPMLLVLDSPLDRTPFEFFLRRTFRCFPFNQTCLGAQRRCS